MLALPKRGIVRSVTKHRSKLSCFCDWIEATVLLEEDELSTTDVVDYLMEQGIYNNQDLCSDLVTSAWRTLRGRLAPLGAGCPTRFRGSMLARVSEWKDAPAHSFCLVVSLAPYYPDWVEEFGADYTEQGELFELLTLEAVRCLFHGWLPAVTGWSRARTTPLEDVVAKLAREIGETAGDVHRWATGLAHEAGLDLVWHLPFPDGRGGSPVFLAQCASGANWKDKLHTPELHVWRKLVMFQTPPAKAFALPFALAEDDFVRRCNQSGGLLLDRCRLLLPCANKQDWVPVVLRDRVNDWLAPRVSWLLSQV